jgi:serine/threonine-protein kinase
VKLLIEQNHSERRKRFFREASALATYSHPSIPRLLETNALYYAKNEYRLYLVVEFIVGPTITERVSQDGAIPLEGAIDLTESLLEIVSYCHSEGGIHRDIKPDNVILRNGRVDHPVLVDFGLSFNDPEIMDFATEDGQELGNRFLRLPELSVGSVLKRDTRTDLTFIAGIFFYAYTGIRPAVLTDAQGRHPHQRENVSSRLAELGFVRAQRMRSLFDRAFQPVIANRFSTADEMRMALKELAHVQPEGSISSADEILIEIRRASESDVADRRRKDGEVIRSADSEVMAIRDAIADLLGPDYWRSQADWHQIAADSASTQIGFTLAHTNRRFMPRFRYRLVGDELVISVSEGQKNGPWKDLLRTSRVTPIFDAAFIGRIKQLFAEGLAAMTA